MSPTTAHLNMTTHRSSLAQTLRHLIPPRLHPLVLLSYPVSSRHASSSLHAEGGRAASSRFGPGLGAYGGESWDGSAGTSSSYGAFSSPRDWLFGSGERLYGKGPNDVLFVLFWAVALTLAREAVIRGVFAPFARRWVGAAGGGGGSGAQQNGGPSGDWKKKGRVKVRNVNGQTNGSAGGKAIKPTAREQRKMNKVVTRFAEQGWQATYYIVSWTMGMFVIGRSTSQPFSSTYLWAGYPHTPLPGLTKFYYLAQTGFWLHQLVIINLEARRRDHHQMLTHHVVTTLLVVGSYIMNFTRVGCLILVLMDFVDIVLPLAKMFGYLGLSRLTDATFVFFLVSWLLTRHIGYNAVLWSVIYRLPYSQPYQWSPERGIYLTRNVVWTFAALLGAIQAMSCMWFYLAVNVAIKVINGGSAEDTRSDDEDDGFEDDSTDTAIEGDGATGSTAAKALSTDNSRVSNGIGGMPVDGVPLESVRKRR